QAHPPEQERGISAHWNCGAPARTHFSFARPGAAYILGTVPAELQTPGKERLMSLDVFRGGTIAAMMLVNNPGTWDHMYAPLDHAEWHGWTFTDLIFPFFLWIVGVAIPLSMGKRLEDGEPK